MDWPTAVFVSIFMTGAFAATAFLVGQVFMTYRAKMSVAREEAYRKLAEEAIHAQARTAEALDRTLAELADVGKRTAELERMLKEVA